MENKPVLIFQTSAFIRKEDIERIGECIAEQVEKGIVLLPAYINFIGAGNADGTVVIKDVNGNIVLWSDDNA